MNENEHLQQNAVNELSINKTFHKVYFSITKTARLDSIKLKRFKIKKIQTLLISGARVAVGDVIGVAYIVFTHKIS